MTNRILVVDDDPEIRNLLAQILHIEGIETVTAGDGEEALNLLLKRSQPSAVLLDIQMPGMSGIEFLEATRETMPTLGPIVIITANVPPGLNDHRVTAVIQKPFGMSEVLEALRRAPRDEIRGSM